MTNPTQNEFGRLVHFAGRFPSRIMINNLRFDLGYAKESYQFLKREDFSTEKIKRATFLGVMLDLDEYIIQQNISVDMIDDKIRRFIPVSEHPHLNDYLPFQELSKPIITYLIHQKHHTDEALFG